MGIGEGAPMNVTEVLSHYFHPGSIHKQPVPEERLIRLLPRMPLDELPPYREHLAILAGGRRGRALDPIWTHAPRDR
jgi:hypothetical protein